jgi:hypothetical protein
VDGHNAGTTGLEERLALLEQQNKDLRRVKDAQEIQNAFSKHEYYHLAGRHGDEMDAVWAQNTPGLSMEEAMLDGCYVGLEAVRGYYVDFFESFFQLARREMLDIFPQAKATPEGGPPGMQILHTLTTPLIEVAEDRETAKALCLSPGYVTAPVDGKLQAFWHWDRYAVDFTRAEGSWKIWHFWVGRDFTTPYETSWVESALHPGPMLALETVPGFPKPNAPSRQRYGGYNPYESPQAVPRLPEPHRTFSETFSY